jgi:hypothetical protein
MRTVSEEVFDEYAVSKEELPTPESCLNKLKEIVDGATKEKPFHHDNDVFETVSPGLIRLVESDPLFDWTDLCDFSIDCWNAVVPTMGGSDEDGKIEKNGVEGYLISSICCGVFDGALSRCASVLGIDQEAFLMVMREYSDGDNGLCLGELSPSMTLGELRELIKGHFDESRRRFLDDCVAMRAEHEVE